MLGVIQALLGSSVEELLHYGQVQLKNLASPWVIVIVNGMRKLLLLQYFVIGVCFLWSLSWFSLGLIAALQIQSEGNFNLHVSAPFIYCLTMGLLTTFVLYFSVREKTWLNAVGLERTKAKVKGGESHNTSNIEEEQIRQIVEKILNEHR